jgi:hypothetical protein
VGAGDFDHTVDYFTDHSTRLVAISTEVAQTSVEGHTLQGEKIYRIGSLKGEVGFGVGGMDLVAGAAILAGWIWISSLKLVRVESRSNTLTEGPT